MNHLVGLRANDCSRLATTLPLMQTTTNFATTNFATQLIAPLPGAIGVEEGNSFHIPVIHDDVPIRHQIPPPLRIKGGAVHCDKAYLAVSDVYRCVHFDGIDVLFEKQWKQLQPEASERLCSEVGGILRTSDAYSSTANNSHQTSPLQQQRHPSVVQRVSFSDVPPPLPGFQLGATALVTAVTTATDTVGSRKRAYSENDNNKSSGHTPTILSMLKQRSTIIPTLSEVVPKSCLAEQIVVETSSNSTIDLPLSDFRVVCAHECATLPDDDAQQRYSKRRLLPHHTCSNIDCNNNNNNNNCCSSSSRDNQDDKDCGVEYELVGNAELVETMRLTPAAYGLHFETHALQLYNSAMSEHAAPEPPSINKRIRSFPESHTGPAMRYQRIITINQDAAVFQQVEHQGIKFVHTPRLLHLAFFLRGRMDAISDRADVVVEIKNRIHPLFDHPKYQIWPREWLQVQSYLRMTDIDRAHLVECHWRNNHMAQLRVIEIRRAPNVWQAVVEPALRAFAYVLYEYMYLASDDVRRQYIRLSFTDRHTTIVGRIRAYLDALHGSGQA